MALPNLDTAKYGKGIAALLGDGKRLPELAPKSGDPMAKAGLEKLDPVVPLLRAGLYLYFDFLDPAHKIAQDIETPDGSFWHGIMHRREPDDENSAYWFRRVGAHPIFSELARLAHDHAKASGDPDLARDLAGKKGWDPFAFIKASSEARRAPSAGRVQLLRELQLLEWNLLFNHCFEQGGLT